MWHLSVPFTVRMIRAAIDQTFVIPTTEPDFEVPLESLALFAHSTGPGAFHWDPHLGRWASDDEGEAGIGAPRPLEGDPPLGTTEAVPRSEE
jgi:hypothetical protein